MEKQSILAYSSLENLNYKKSEEIMTELPNPTCFDCKAFYKEAQNEHGKIFGLCMIRKELGEIPANLEYCSHFKLKESRADFVKNVIIKPQVSKRQRASSSDGATMLEIPTLKNPVEGDTEGEITVDRNGLKQVLRELLEEETMYGYPKMADKWEDGTLIIKPADPEKQEKEIPVDTFFHKIVMLRDRLRVLEAKVNSHDTLSETDKVELQGYISKCYGTLTTFNTMFKNKENHFKSKS